MKISVHFSVEHPARPVWDFLQDVPAVIACIPGSEYLGREGQAAHRARVRVKIGPIATAFEGDGTIVNADAESLTGEIKGKGIDRQGGSRASMAAAYRLTGREDGTTRVDVEADVKLAGALAQIGRTGILQDVAEHLTAQFAERMRQRINATAEPGQGTAPGGETGEMGGIGLFLAVLRRVLKRLLGTRRTAV